jgi:hypothetical protein
VRSSAEDALQGKRGDGADDHHRHVGLSTPSAPTPAAEVARVSSASIPDAGGHVTALWPLRAATANAHPMRMMLVNLASTRMARGLSGTDPREISPDAVWSVSAMWSKTQEAESANAACRAAVEPRASSVVA